MFIFRWFPLIWIVLYQIQQSVFVTERKILDFAQLSDLFLL